LVVLALAACQQAADDGSLPSDQAAGPIASVKNHTVTEGVTLFDRVSRAFASLRQKGVKVVENGWRAYPGPGDCPGCVAVHFVVTIDGTSEKYEFLVKDGGKTVEGLNEGAKALLEQPPPPAPKVAPPAEGAAPVEAAPPAAAPAEGAPPAEAPKPAEAAPAVPPAPPAEAPKTE
jgi:hypothetical protein